MPFDPVKVALAMDGGLSAVCAACVKYWTARDRGVPGDACLAQEGCGGPLSGDAFHEYEGPAKGILHTFCFACGEKVRYLAKVKNKGEVGVCATHLKLFDRLQPQGKEVREERPTELLGPDGEPVRKPVPQKSLIAAIAEVEAHYAAKEQ